MLKKLLTYLVCITCIIAIAGCSGEQKKPKIGVSFGVGPAVRWDKEKDFMLQRAKELNMDAKILINRISPGQKKTQEEDCIEMIDSGIDVLIVMPRDSNKIIKVLEYAKKKGVKTIAYARTIIGGDMDLFVGYDSFQIGQSMAKPLIEKVDKGDYIILSGDKGDDNALLLYQGAMSVLEPMKKSGSINVILDTDVPGWSPDTAKKLVTNAIIKNNNNINAIFAPNDKIAGAAYKALDELGIKKPVMITGMDAELPAVRRIVNDQQYLTVYMDLKMLANAAIDEAYNFATKKKISANAEFDNGNKGKLSAYLISGQVIIKENINKILIDSGYYSRDDVYGN